MSKETVVESAPAFDPETDKYYTTSQIAEMFSVSQETVRDWISSKKLEAIRLGSGHLRVPRTILMAFANHKYAQPPES